MARNKHFLIDYQEIDGDFVAFGGSTRGGKITSKEKIRTGPQETNGDTGLKNNDARQTGEDNVSTQQYIMLPLWSSIFSSYKSSDENDGYDIANDAADNKTIQDLSIQDKQALRDALDKMMDPEKEATKQSNDHAYDDDLDTYNYPFADQVVGSKADFNNMEPSNVFSPIPTTRVHTIHPKNQIIRDPKLAVQTRGMTKQSSREHMDVKSAFLYGTIKEEVFVCQPPGFVDPVSPEKVYKVEKALYGLHQAPRAWYEILSTYLLDNGFHRGQIDKTLFIKRFKVDILLIHVDNETAICVVKNPIYHSKTKHIEIMHHFIRGSYEKRMIEMGKIHTDHNVANLLTKGFDVSRLEMLFGVDLGVKHVNDVKHIHAIIDRKAVMVTEASVRSSLLFNVVNAHTLKVFSNMSRKGQKFSGRITLLFPSMLAQQAVAEGEGSGNPPESQPTPSCSNCN
nr:reverse transcriptase [Tanacetum cinerariifolium]